MRRQQSAGYVTSIRVEAELRARTEEAARCERLSLSEWARRTFVEALAREAGAQKSSAELAA